MEAVPKLPLLCFELKLSHENTHFGPKLKQYIAEAYREDPDSYGNEIHQLEGLRSAAVRSTTDSAGLNALIKYFCQLRAMQSRFPMAKGQPAACSFSWKDLYASMSCSLSDIRFEMACILYNIGALHTQLGSSEPRTSADSLKAACTHYQNAAWAFQYLREQYPQPPGVDVSTEIMRLLQEICFAEAQECILEKSIQDTRKPSVVGAVATQVMHFYKNSMALLGPSTGTDNIHEIIGTKLYNFWFRYLSFKHSYIGCIVCIYQGMNAEEQQKMGERVAFYQIAVDKLNDARKLAKYIEPVQITQEALTFTNDVVEGKKKAAKNENEFIYHEEVPEKDFLVEMKPVCLVKALPINFNDPQLSGPDVFGRLVPIGAHEASSLYSEEKAKLLRRVAGQAEARSTELTEFMSSLQLDQLDVIDADHKIPQEIVDRCAAMNAKTEIIQSLVDSMNSLAEIIGDVEHALSEIKNLIQEESAKEKEYQKSMGPRPPSIVHTELSREYHKYLEAHTRTTESNQVLHKAMTLHIANLRLLAQPLDVLQAKIPSIDNIEGLDRETMVEMRRVVGKAREMQAQRDALVQQLRADVTADDVTAQLLARSSEPAEEIFKQEIEKHTPTVKIIEQNLAAQENIINRLTSLYASYGDSRRLLTDVLRKRDGLINALITSYDTYEELLGKSQKGLEFYKKLAHNVGQLLARLRSTCQVHDEERTQMLNTQNSRASTPGSSVSSSSKSTNLDAVPSPPAAGPRKLKDYLPYMKNRSAARGAIPPGPMPVEPLAPEGYYPESIYPTSVRPTPVGSEGTDLQTQLPDGAVPPMQTNPYDRYPGSYAPDPEPYAPYAYPQKPEEYAGGYTAYTPPQYSQNDQHAYSNPYYSATHDNTPAVTDSQNSQYRTNASHANINPNANPYGSYMQNNQTPNPDVVSAVSAYSNTELNASFGQMNIAQKSEPSTSYGNYTQTYYNVQYPQTSTPTVQVLSPGPAAPSQASAATEYTAGYQYNSADTSQYAPAMNAAHSEQLPYNAAYGNTSQGYTVYTNTDSSATSATSVNPAAMSQPYAPYQPDYINPALPHLDALEKPIKSHVTGEALSNNYSAYQGYDSTAQGFPSPGQSYGQNYQTEQPYPPIGSFNTDQTASNYGQTPTASNYGQTPTASNYGQTPTASNYGHAPTAANFGQTSTVPNNDQPQTAASYGQTYQNHPGYTFNMASGNYEYAYGSQNSYTGNEPNQTPQGKDGWHPHGTYTNAGACETVQSPSETPQPADTSNAQVYYNVPYGYITANNQAQTVQPMAAPDATNYGANVNQSTYMQSGQPRDTSVTYSSNGVSTTKENVDPNYDQSLGQNQTQAHQYSNSEPAQNVGYGQSTEPNAQQTYQNQRPLDQSQQNVAYNQNPEANIQQSYQSQQNVTYNQNTDPSIQNNLPTQNDTNGHNYDQNPTYNQSQNTAQSTAYSQNSYNQSQDQSLPPNTVVSEPSNQTQQEVESLVSNPETKSVLSVFDLLSEIDFTVEQRPLMPDIKVPQISESSIKKQVILPKDPVKIVPKEKVIERPAKRDLFSDPSLLNKFTQEVKNLQKLTDSLSNVTPSGMTLLDSKWKMLQDVQTKENMTRSKTVAMQHSSGNIIAEVAPFDDSRLTLKSNPDAYINASYYKQLAPWCIPIVISKNPIEDEYNIFWKAVLEYKIVCVVCLLSEIEMQGKTYWPTAKGQSLELAGGLRVTLDDVSCSVHWTARRLTLTSGPSAALSVTHYQINVFPAKIVCSPLVFLADRLLQQTYEGRLSNQLAGCWLQCAEGAGRSCVLALLIMTMCQVRAGQLHLADTLDVGCINLYKHRSNVLEDTKYLADAYRTALFYVQGVLCSGTTMFSGEAVSVPSGADVAPPSPAAPAAPAPKAKFSRESFEEMKQSPGLTSGDMKDPLNFLDPLWSLKKK